MPHSRVCSALSHPSAKTTHAVLRAPAGPTQPKEGFARSHGRCQGRGQDPQSGPSTPCHTPLCPLLSSWSSARAKRGSHSAWHGRSATGCGPSRELSLSHLTWPADVKEALESLTYGCEPPGCRDSSSPVSPCGKIAIIVLTPWACSKDEKRS